MGLRTTARSVLPLLLLAVVAGPAAALSNGTSGKVPRLIFPVVGEAKYEDDFGDARGQGGHEGNDILAPRRAVAVATEAGTVKFWKQSRAGCMLYLHGASGTTYLYIHLNNDLGDTNDNRGKCIRGVAYAPRLKNGARVEAGQPVGFVGDSGDAAGIDPHLHFEVHPNDGPAVNPFRRLNRAQRLFFAVEPGTTVTLTVAGAVVQSGTGRLKVRVDELSVFPTGAKVKPGRQLTLGFPPTALVDTGGGQVAPPGPELDAALAGKAVLVLTEPTPATLHAALGVPGALSAARVVLAPAPATR